MSNDSEYENQRLRLCEEYKRAEARTLFHEKYWCEIECDREDSLEDKLEDYHEDRLKYELAQLEQTRIEKDPDWMYKTAVKLWGQETADKAVRLGFIK